MKYYKIREDELIYLWMDYHYLTALEENGVDSWSGFGSNFDKYVANYLNTDTETVRSKGLEFLDCALKELDKYEVIE